MDVAPVVESSRGGPYPAPKTCLAEVFSDAGVVDAALGTPYAAILETTRPLRLIDLGDSDWLTRAGGNGAISSGSRGPSREWARATHVRYRSDDGVDGVIYPSSNIPVARSAALWERAEDALPPRPPFNEPLSHPNLRAALETCATELGRGADHLTLTPGADGR